MIRAYPDEYRNERVGAAAVSRSGRGGSFTSRERSASLFPYRVSADGCRDPHLGPLATYAEPHCYDLCAVHADRLTAPRGWEIVRLSPEFEPAAPSHDDLLALADAVREAARPRPEDAVAGVDAELSAVEVGRRGHLRVLRDPLP